MFRMSMQTIHLQGAEMTKPKTKRKMIKIDEITWEKHNQTMAYLFEKKGYAQALADVERIAIKNVGVIPSDWDDFIIKIQALKEQK